MSTTTSTIWHKIRVWQRSRPFWGSVTLCLGGYFVAQPLLGGSWAFYTALGTRGLTPVLLGGTMIAAALIALFVPGQRHFPAIIAAMVSVASLPLANLGGWIIGMVFGIVGAGLTFAWTPYTQKELARFAEKDARRAARRAARRGESEAIGHAA